MRSLLVATLRSHLLVSSLGRHVQHIYADCWLPLCIAPGNVLQADDMEVMEAQNQSELAALTAAADSSRARAAAAEAAAAASSTRAETLAEELAGAEAALTAAKEATAAAADAVRQQHAAEVAGLQQQLQQARGEGQQEVVRLQEQCETLQVGDICGLL
jgi:chromosome segregation ATPase